MKAREATGSISVVGPDVGPVDIEARGSLLATNVFQSNRTHSKARCQIRKLFRAVLPKSILPVLCERSPDHRAAIRASLWTWRLSHCCDGGKFTRFGLLANGGNKKSNSRDIFASARTEVVQRKSTKLVKSRIAGGPQFRSSILHSFRNAPLDTCDLRSSRFAKATDRKLLGHSFQMEARRHQPGLVRLGAKYCILPAWRLLCI